ncbi:hypothetical protein ILUMI_11701 [Ignelater luminosus]|uniref:Uncharacterized protein n=1 Tax=Ignelater luminosus TaxID=2038154 RepID=A0A8K0D1N8_IGNLU|nr:hypothetical protein ILUMI_11701 [Ignelater luminosus]
MDSLVRQSGSVKARLTRFEDYLCEIKTKIETNNGVLENCDVIQIRKRLLTIQPLLNTFDQLQLQTENAREDPERDSVVSCHEVLVPGPVVVTSDVVRTNGGSRSSSNMVHKGFVKLPTINLPNFNGNPEEWLNFRDLFINLKRENEALTDVHKLHYLRASVTGKAQQIIRSLGILDPTTTRKFENKNDSGKFPSYEELINFMEKKASLLETIYQRNQKSHAERLIAKAFVSTAISCPLL